MLTSNRAALKEWTAVERILATGQASVLLRKGGIAERKEGFEVEHREFWIFPSLFHQTVQELNPAFVAGVTEEAVTSPPADTARIGTYTEVVEAFRVVDMEALRRLEGLHPLAPETVEARFHYRQRPYLHVLLLRVYSMPAPHVIRNTLGYEGCVSWVQLDEPLGTSGATAVLSNAEFRETRSEVLDRLGHA